MRLLPRSFLRSIALSAAAIGALAGSAEATWSIVMIDTATGEVAIGCATCLENFDLEVYCPVMVVGYGGACAQSSIDSSGTNRRLIRDELKKRTHPATILQLLRNGDPNHQSRQYGIVDLVGRERTFTGSQAGAWAGGVTGVIGTSPYAIQGNVLAGDAVVLDAEQAVLNTSGDLAERLMAGMEAAQQVGGDGRCSCDPSDADKCGAPPPGYDPSTDKSAHCGFMMISRFGDTDGGCNASVGCADGSYWMDLNVPNQKWSDPDPVLQLRGLFDTWRNDLRGHPDQILSTQAMSRKSRPGNGTTPVTLTITLADWEGTPITQGGATVEVSHSDTSAGLSAIGTVVDHGDGSYEVEFDGGVGQGLDQFVVTVDDGQGAVTLYPYPTLNHTETLKASATSISAAAGGTIDFDLVGPDRNPPDDYLLLCSASGTSPGMVVGPLVLPLNWDDVVFYSWLWANSTTFITNDGVLDGAGLAAAGFHAEPDELTPLIGFDLAFAYLTNGPVSFASNFKLVTIDP